MNKFENGFTPEQPEHSEFEKRLDQIKLGIEKLKKLDTPITQEQLSRNSEKEDLLFEKFDERTAEEEKEYRTIREKNEGSCLIVDNLAELQYALEYLNMFTQQEITNIVSHENAHANKMESLGINCRGYGIVVFKRKDGKDWPMITTIPDDFPTDWDIEKKREVHKKIAEAPAEYESNYPPSSFDEAMINRMTKDGEDEKN